MGAGTATLSYRPIPFDGSFDRLGDPDRARPAVAAGCRAAARRSSRWRSVPVACTDLHNTLPEGCEPRRDDFLPEVEIFDLGDGLVGSAAAGSTPKRVQPQGPGALRRSATGQVLVRFVNDNPEMSVGFGFQVALAGEIE